MIRWARSSDGCHMAAGHMYPYTCSGWDGCLVLARIKLAKRRSQGAIPPLARIRFLPPDQKKEAKLNYRFRVKI